MMLAAAQAITPALRSHLAEVGDMPCLRMIFFDGEEAFKCCPWHTPASVRLAWVACQRGVRTGSRWRLDWQGMDRHGLYVRLAASCCRMGPRACAVRRRRIPSGINALPCSLGSARDRAPGHHLAGKTPAESARAA
jgi:hypothetical protein